MITLPLVIYSSLAAIFGVSFVAGLLSSQRSRSDNEAARTWRNITHRNGVTAPIPFASTSAPVNAPGLVRVYPKSQQPEPIKERELVAATCSPVHTPGPQVQPACPAPVSASNPADGMDSSDSAALKLPMEIAEAASDEEREAVMKLHREGRPMTAVILTVWGAKSGGSKKYKAARDRYMFYIAEVENDG